MTPKAWLARQRREVVGPLRLAALCGTIEGGLIIAQAGFIAWLIQQVIMNERPLADFMLPALGLIGVVALRPVFASLRSAAGISAAATVRATVRRRLIHHVESLGPAGLADVSSGELSSQLTDQVDALDGYFARYVPQMTIAVIVPLSIAVAAYSQDWIAASFLLLSAPLIPLFMALVGMGAERLNRDQFLALGRLSGQFLDRVRGLTTLRLFGRTQDAADGIVSGSDEYRQRSMRVLRVAFLSSAVLEFFASVAIAVVAIYIGFGLLGYIEYGPSPQLTLFSGLFILLLAPEFFQPLRTLAQHYHDRATALGAAELLNELESRPTAEEGFGTGTLLEGENFGTGTLQISGLRVDRVGRGTVLYAESFNVDAGERVLIEGPSGTGKTSLLLAIAGLLPPASGEIDRRFPDPRIGWLGSPPFLANASIRANIRFGNPEADDPMILEAARQAGVMEFTERLEQGLDTVVGERGLSLSGGQAQRVALARALVSPAPMILLDEPTNALDATTEAYVLQAINALASEGRAIVISSHDAALRTVADRRYRISEQRLEMIADE
ncbi:thiol reductant ABC exporter subunit CydD [Spiribacter vilamensis]|uniref:ATP-binding cassette subfamily C protein CydD n=1 Tax=Spiribacter vilamensis TaxID=531306 RepID=A0A4Q8D1Z4_9GAMM|nr:thiol reductant ABC exporter subunit CydD [Spiribacter vilamensis]RZU99389.1 ATP-binding cassette subfamily C protein CydD [Spiribacter vilamensis]TVO61634.1 thiol reductant ABC exporter subunit CydD [Spiribacter vilamensis]